MQRAVAQRDTAYDGIFFLGVRTTGIFCRPACPARKPRPENVEFFATADQAMQAGFRPCKRCRPFEINDRYPAWVSHLLAQVQENGTTRLRDADLRDLGVDPARARRYFREEFGMTFQAYQRATNVGGALRQLQDGDDALRVGLDAGFESASGFRDAFARVFGSPPGDHDQLPCAVCSMISSPVGPLIAAATDDGVCLLEFADRKALARQIATLRKRVGVAVVPGMNAHLEQLTTELADYFGGTLKAFAVSLVTPGTPFQQTVWNRLCEISYGDTMSYEQLARDIGRPGGQRAVGRANGDNRVAIVIPCHRVVQKNGELRGYGGGLWRKRFLLDLEREAFVPSTRPLAESSDRRLHAAAGTAR